jgi:hypothetical protein
LDLPLKCILGADPTIAAFYLKIRLDLYETNSE